MRFNRRRKVSTGTEKTLSGQLLGLSLFIMLLAFFIVLNAISSFEQTKVKPVIQSIGYAFGSKVSIPRHEDSAATVTEKSTNSLEEGDTIDRLEALFNTQIPGTETVVSKEKGLMYVRVPFDEFENAVLMAGQRNAFEDGTSQGQFSRIFLPTMVALLKSDSAAMPYRMDIALQVGENPARLFNDNPQKMKLLSGRLSGLAERMEATGLPDRLMSIGFDQGTDNMVVILFRRHIPYSPLGEDYETGQ